MLLEIVKYPDPFLRKICGPVTRITPELRTLASDMLETMYEAKGVGLAAPQIGRSLRMIVMDPAANEEEKQPQVLVNPELELFGDVIVSEKEGCLSVPLNYRADVQRHSHVKLKALDLDGNPVEKIMEGFAAIVVQHEADHLDGNLFIDKISHLRRVMYDGKVKKWMKRKNSA